jgi:hypothetical protein
MVNGILANEPGRLLEWSVEIDWGPLCSFLGKPVPENMEFPHGNALKEFLVKAARVSVERNSEAQQNMAIFLAVLLVSVIAVLGGFTARMEGA